MEKKNYSIGQEKMAKQPLLKMEGVITDTLSNANFRVELDSGHELLCTISGKMRMNYIKIMTGDRVEVEISPYDLNRGRICKRLKAQN